MRDESMHRITTWATLSIFCLFTALAPGCGSGGDGGGARSPVRYDLDGAACGGELRAEAAASRNVREATGVASYELHAQGSLLVIDLYDGEGDPLGQLRTDLELHVDPATSWNVTTAYLIDGEVRASQRLHGSALGGGRAQLRIVNEAGEHRAITWATLDEEVELERMTLGQPVEDGGIATLDGNFELLDTMVDGVELPSAEIQGWIDERPLAALASDPDWQLLRLVADDPAWQQAASTELRRCQAFGVEEAEAAAFTTAQQALCSGLGEASPGVVRQGACGTQDNPFSRVFTAEGVLGAITTSATITTALIATGVVSGGLAIGAVLVGVAVATYLVSNKIDGLVESNREEVVRGTVWVGGGIKDRNRSDNDDAVDFFGGSAGDPHLDTFDGLAYDFQSAGEFVLVRSTTDDGFEVQVRQEPLRGICSGVAVNTALAARIGSDRIGFHVDDSDAFLVEGERVELAGGALVLPGGGSIERGSGGYVVRWPGGERLHLGSRGNFRLALPDSRRSAVEGLLGNFNGDRLDDIAHADGTVLEQPVGWTALTTAFADSWRIDAGSSLFDYGEGEGPDSFLVAGFPEKPASVEELPPEVEADARRICTDAGVENEEALEGCILDVGCTGDPGYAEDHRDRSPEEGLQVATPVSLHDWQAGLPGVWDVTADGRSVHVEGADLPHFFFSDRDYLGWRYRGTIQVEEAPTGFVGWIAGYRVADGAQTVLFAWNPATRTEEGFEAQEGFTLAHLNGTVGPEATTRVFHGFEGEEIDVLDTHYGAGLGWEQGSEHRFEVIYAEEAISISIDGVEVLSADAPEGLPFWEGQLGFYVYGQSGVTFSDVELVRR